ncbi:selenocysteine-specific translation elongation factor [Cupriavidus pauculus]|uniref:Selenocysteine-specific elongation factor n=1 Tax=Cupriavidus pauculus TaxID=82633 RepID=A0A5P2HEF4_9BURK|nr:selenocysteine-specific translation elongation factor [Cupriavidus pauculus]QET06422.1 selenocysteine-specific translation elongation factor [Cupriavidus pauculus]
MIVGTAGHIDHGKTTLVRTLTGVDTDRLKEEKARGISIELGYAYTPLPNGDVLGYIDVPGHEKLIHTMAAGASGIDLALLVIAADDGVMPQTREHLAIVQRLGVPRAAVALTKADRVDAARLGAVEADVAALLADTPYADAPRFPLDGTDAGHAGVLALRAYLHDAAMRMPARREAGLFRLAVDRVFTLAGHGTVVTGTVFNGHVRVGDAMQLAPAGLPVRIRSIHAQQRAAEVGVAGQRCALNLAGIDKDAIRRGDWIMDPALLPPSPVTRLDVSLALTPGIDVRVGHWTPVHVHLGATHRTANVVLLDREVLTAGRMDAATGALPAGPSSAGLPSAGSDGDGAQRGGMALAQLVFTSPVCAQAGDRLILRNAQATQTIGGGTVLDNVAPERHRRTPARLDWLRAIAAMLDGAGLAPLLAQAPHGIAHGRLVRLTGLPPEAWDVPPDALSFGGTGRGASPDGHAAPSHAGSRHAAGEDRCLILAPYLQALRQRILDTLTAFHARLPDEPGLNAGSLRRLAFAGAAVPDALWTALLDALLADGELDRHGGWLRLPTHEIAMTDAERALADELLPRVLAGGNDPPWVRDHAAALNAPEDAVRALLRKLARQGAIHQVVRDLFYADATIDTLAAQLASLAQTHTRVEAVHFRDAVGLGRKRAIQILEFFDRAGYTRRVGNGRMLRPNTEWSRETDPQQH